MDRTTLAVYYLLVSPLLYHKGLWRHLDIERNRLEIHKVRRAIKPYSHGEQLVAKAALSLWHNEKLVLSELVSTLSDSNLTRVLHAIEIAAGQRVPTDAELRLPEYTTE